MEGAQPNVRDYREFYDTFQWNVPAYYNFAFDVLDSRAEKHDKTALITVSPDGERAQRHTFRDLSILSNKFANVLLADGMDAGTRVLVMLPRIPEWYVAVLGTMKISGVYMPTPALSTAKDLKYRINSAGAQVVVTCSEFADRIDKIREECPSLKQFILVGDRKNGWTNYERAMETAPDFIKSGSVRQTRSSDDMLIFFTSGTEGPPKMVLHSYAYALGHYISAFAVQDVKPEDVTWTLADPGWAKTAYGKLFGQWMIGATVLQWNTTGKFDSLIMLKVLEKYNVSVFCAPPTAYRMIIKENLRGFVFPKLRHALSIGEPLNPRVISLWKEATGLEIYDYYGQTETVPLIGNMRAFPIKPGSMGRITPGHLVAIVDEGGTVLPDGEEGFIAVRTVPSRPPGLMTGYWRNEDGNRKAFRGDW